MHSAQYAQGCRGSGRLGAFAAARLTGYRLVAVANADVWGTPIDEDFSFNAMSAEAAVALHHISQLGHHLMTGNARFWPITDLGQGD